MKDRKIKPIIRRRVAVSYQCPICLKGGMYWMSQIKEHLSTPVDEPIPTGFVYKKLPGKVSLAEPDKRFNYTIIAPYSSGRDSISTGRLGEGTFVKEFPIHSRLHMGITYRPLNTDLSFSPYHFAGGGRDPIGLPLSSISLRNALREHSAEFLSKDEFKDFSEWIYTLEALAEELLSDKTWEYQGGDYDACLKMKELRKIAPELIRTIPLNK